MASKRNTPLISELCVVSSGYWTACYVSKELQCLRFLPARDGLRGGPSGGGRRPGDAGLAARRRCVGRETDTAPAAAGLVHGNMGDQKGSTEGLFSPMDNINY